MSVLYFIGFIQSLFVSSLILTKRKKKLPDYILAFYILVMGFFLGFIYAQESGIYEKTPLIIILDILYWVWIGPALFLYIDLITSKDGKLRLVHLVHLIPTAIVFIGFGGFFFDNTVTHFEEYQSDSFLFNLATYVWYYNSPVYYIICLFKLRKHKKNVREYYSYTKNVDLKWLNYLVHGFAAFLIFGLLTGLMRAYLGIELPFGSMHYTWLVMVLYIFGMGYFGYLQKVVSTNTTEISTSENSSAAKSELNLINEVKNTNLQYLRSGLNKEESIEILKRLTSIMEIEKPFTNYELNLRELAHIVQTTPHKLSQVINEQLNYNFFEFVNNYRVEEVKKALVKSDNSDLKIMSIAYDCGFSSKSAFYTIFKKKTSKTPTAYREELMAGKIIT